MFSDLVYARVREEGTGYLPGGVIRPKSRQWLTIPLERFPIGARASDDRRLRLRKARSGKLFLVLPAAAKSGRLSQPARSKALVGRLPPILKGDTLKWLLAKEVRQEGAGYLARAAAVAGPLLEDFARDYWAAAMLAETAAPVA